VVEELPAEQMVLARTVAHARSGKGPGVPLRDQRGWVDPDLRDPEFPGDLGTIQRFEASKYYNTRMREDSQLAEELESTLRRYAPALAAMIDRAAPFSKLWPASAADDQTYYDTFSPRREISKCGGH
jgi:hypothetical protein